MAVTPPPLAHVALTVSDLDRSVEWYTALFAASPALVDDFLTDTPHAYRAAIWLTPSFALHSFESSQTDHGEFPPGLDHVAFACGSIDEIDDWVVHLDGLDIDHGEPLTEWYGTGLAFRDPDGIGLEVFRQAGPADDTGSHR